MTRFVFRSYDARGHLETGELDAPTRAEALQVLARQGRFPIAVEVGHDGAGRGVASRLLGAHGRPRALSIADQQVLARELAALTKAQLPIDEALRIVAMQPGLGRAGRRFAEQVLDRVMAGSSLADALAHDTATVPEYFWRMVKAGESSGSLAQVFQELATSIEATARIRSQIVSAMIYPAFLVGASLLTLSVIVLVMIPAMLPLFQDAGAELPAFVAAIVALQSWLAATWPVLLVAMALAAAAAASAARRTDVRRWIDGVMTKVPVVAPLVVRHNTARLARTLAMLTRNGVPTLEALQISAQVLPNRAFRASVESAVEEINRGGSLLDSLSRSKLYPQLALRLISVGERTGQLIPMLARVADLYEHDLQQRIQRLLALASPVATLAIGGMVGLLVVSVMNAVLSLNQMALR